MTYPTFSNRDFKTGGQPRKRRLHRGHLHLLAVASGAVGLIALFSPTHDAEATRQLDQPEPVSLHLELPKSTGAAVPVVAEPPAPKLPDPTRDWQTVEVNSGDTLSAVFDRQGLGPQEVHAVVNAGEKAKMLNRLRPGQTFKLDIGEGRLKALHYIIDATKTLAFDRTEDGFETRLIEKELEIRNKYATGTIEGSLYASALKAGLSEPVIMELGGIFGWDVDFALDIRRGDRFKILYEEKYLDGEKYRDGAILAAEFHNRGEVYKAVRFTDPEGRSNYFGADGRSMRKAFLRSPVDFRRISSRFQPERYHPILGKKRPHRGVDYAAATGTPIKAAGDGRIVYRGRKGGYGRTIIVKHGGRYSTLYAHMSRYRGGLGVGSRVRQGQVIGYVGQSGLATGPHLHYEFRVNGVHRNPLTVKLPDAEPIKSAYREQFEKQAQALLSQLDAQGETRLAESAP